MRVQILRPKSARAEGDQRTAAVSENGANRPPTTTATRFNQRSFLKLAGTSLGLGLAARLAAPAQPALAQAMGDPDTYLNGSLYGPAGALNLYSQYTNSSPGDAVQVYVYPPGTTSATKALAVQNNGVLDLNSNGMINVASIGGTQMTANLDMGLNNINNVSLVSSPPLDSLPTFYILGWRYIALKTIRPGSMTWYGNTSTSQFSVDNAGNVTFAGTLGGAAWKAGSVLFVSATNGTFGQDQAQFYWDDVNHRLGIGSGSWLPTVQPQATLSVVAPGAGEIGGGAMSAVLRGSAGTLGTTAGSELGLASIGFQSGNSIALGVRGCTVGGGSGWSVTQVGLGLDVDGTVRSGPSLWLSGTGNVGIQSGTAQGTAWAPQAALHLNNGQFKIGSTLIADSSGCYYS